VSTPPRKTESQSIAPHAFDGAPVVDAEEALGRSDQAELFGHLTTARVEWRLAGLDAAAGQLPGLLVDGLDEKHTTVLVEEDTPCSHLLGRE
jgi:hypothetical protein